MTTKKTFPSETSAKSLPHLSEYTAGISTLAYARLPGIIGPVSSAALDKVKLKLHSAILTCNTANYIIQQYSSVVNTYRYIFVNF